jgi:hypothetical protein
MRTTIYGLVDPRQPDVIRYVGKTRQMLFVRLRKHCLVKGRERNGTHRGHWISALQSSGVQPVALVFFRVASKYEDQAERAMIVRLRNAGHPLTNGRPGGEGGALPPELLIRALATKRERRAAGLYQNPVWLPEVREAVNKQISARMRSHNPMMDPEVRAKNSASQRARHLARGYIPKIRKARGSPEWLEMMRGRARELAADPLVRSAISIALTDKPKTRKHRANLAASQAAKATLFLNGTRMPLLAIARRLGIDRKTIRDRASRHKITLQEAIDFYARSIS